MGLFDKLFGNEEKKGGCCDIHIEEVAESQNGDSSQTDVEGSAPSPAQELVVMGPGCRKCHQLEENARAAVEASPGLSPCAMCRTLRPWPPPGSWPPPHSSWTARWSPRQGAERAEIAGML